MRPQQKNTRVRQNGWYRCRLRFPVRPDESPWLALYWKDGIWIGVHSQSAVEEVGDRIWMPDEDEEDEVEG